MNKFLYIIIILLFSSTLHAQTYDVVEFSPILKTVRTSEYVFSGDVFSTDGTEGETAQMFGTTLAWHMDDESATLIVCEMTSFYLFGYRIDVVGSGEYCFFLIFGQTNNFIR